MANSRLRPLGCRLEGLGNEYGHVAAGHVSTIFLTRKSPVRLKGFRSNVAFRIPESTD